MSESGYCVACEQMLPAEAFRPNPKLSDGLDSWCKACRSEYNCQLEDRQRRARRRGGGAVQRGSAQGARAGSVAEGMLGVWRGVPASALGCADVLEALPLSSLPPVGNFVPSVRSRRARVLAPFQTVPLPAVEGHHALALAPAHRRSALRKEARHPLTQGRYHSRRIWYATEGVSSGDAFRPFSGHDLRHQMQSRRRCH